MMAATPAVPLSMLGLSLLCLSVLRGSAADSALPSPAAVPHKAPQSHGHTAEPKTTGSTATNTTVGANADGSVTRGPYSSNGTTDITEHTTLVSTSSRAETTTGLTHLRTATMTREVETPKPGASLSTRITIILTILVTLLILFLVILTRWMMNRSRHRAGGVRGSLVAGVQAVQSRLGIRLWPGKSGGLGDGEEEEEREDVEGDVEQGKGRNAESQEEKREEEEEDDSSDDYSSLEGCDLRERARQREGEEEEGKRVSQNQGKEEGGESGGATPAEKSEGGGMEECDLTAL